MKPASKSPSPAVPAAVRQARRPPPLPQRPNESNRAYQAFLVWALFDDERRSLRVVADTLGASRRSVSTWSKRNGWVRRVQRVAHLERCALVSYYAFISRRIEEELLAELEAPLASVLVGAPPELLRLAEHGLGLVGPLPSAAHDPAARFKMVIEGGIDLVWEDIKRGRITPKLSDLPRLVKAHQLVSGLPTARHEIQGAPGLVEGAMSVRLRQAMDAEDPRKLLGAMREELAELEALVEGVEAMLEQEGVNVGAVIDVEVSS